MNAALLHLNLSGGPQSANLLKIDQAIQQAATRGASWIVTPETALQGYFFAQKGVDLPIPVQPSPELAALRQTIAHHKATVFLGCAEQDPQSGLHHNSCLVIGPDGDVLGRHRKLRSHGVGAEAWLTTGDSLNPVRCGKHNAGILICADAWYSEHAIQLKEKQADLMIMLAAWPPGPCGPADSWERCSLVSGLPLWVCNQTGNQESLDMTRAESAVIVNGQKKFTYSGLEEGILLFDWDFNTQSSGSNDFTFVAI